MGEKKRAREDDRVRKIEKLKSAPTTARIRGRYRGRAARWDVLKLRQGPHQQIG